MQNDIAAYRAEGMTYTGISNLTGLSMNQVDRIVRQPATQERILELRRIWESVAHEKLTDMSDKTMALVEETIDAKDPKGFDQVMRGVANMERVSASVAGVGRKVEVTGLPPVVDARAILVQLFGTDHDRLGGS